MSRRVRGRIPAEAALKLHLGDIVAYQAIDYRVEGIIDYVLGDRTLRFAAIAAASCLGLRFIEPVVVADRVLLLSEIENLDINSPPPATIYHHGESYLLKISGDATVDVVGKVDDRQSGPCRLWRFRAAGGQHLQIEQWPDRIRMLAGTTIHKGMLEVRPATP
jgi:hypothetical protein